MAEGSYKPDVLRTDNIIQGGAFNDPRTHSFVVKRPVSIYGGYEGYISPGVGGHTNPLWPDGDKPTILDGNIGDPSKKKDNTVHVVWVNAVSAHWEDANLRFRDLAILNGRAKGYADPQFKRGGGIWSHSGAIEFVKNVTVRACTADTLGGGVYIGGIDESNAQRAPAFRCALSLISGNAADVGAGVYIGDSTMRYVREDETGVSAVFNTLFMDNDAREKGGALFIRGDHEAWDEPDGPGYRPGFMFSNNLVRNNTAAWGGGIYVESSGSTAANYDDIATFWVNNTFSANYAVFNGGGMYVEEDANIRLRNAISYGNTAGAGPVACDVFYPDPTFTPLPANLAIQNADIGPSSNGIDWYLVAAAGTLPGVANVIGDDPKFRSPALDEYSLKPSSPAIEVGNDNFLPLDTMSIDEDSNTNELLPLDYVRFDSSGQLKKWRELLLPGGPNPPTLGTITGLDAGARLGVVDLGCYEHDAALGGGIED